MPYQSGCWNPHNKMSLFPVQLMYCIKIIGVRVGGQSLSPLVDHEFLENTDRISLVLVVLCLERVFGSSQTFCKGFLTQGN